MDRFYTPPHLAETLINHAKIITAQPFVADFAVGHGELLRAAIARWPKAGLLGIDVNPHTVTRLSQEHPSWSIARCNFLNARQRNLLNELRDSKGKLDLVLLNPPFSNRGGQRRQVELNGRRVTCSLGLAFLITALSYLAPCGEVLAILPAGTLHSEMDSDAWAAIDSFFSRSVLRSNGERTFKDCLAKTVIVQLVARPLVKKPKSVPDAHQRTTKQAIIGLVEIERGRVDMPSLNGARIKMAIPLVHTTELKGHRVDLSRRRIDASQATLKSYAVLLPRVGRPSADKICLHTVRTPVALSNCILAVKCKRLNEAKLIQQKFLGKWEIIKQAYVGTCAPYVTLHRLRHILRELNYRVDEES